MLLFTSSPLINRAVAFCLGIFVLFGGLASLHIHGARDLADDERSKGKSFAQDNVEFSWDMLPPAKELHWHKCFPRRQCARLIVPLDYSDPHGAEAIIALIRKPSTLADSSPEYRGPILFHPGGPDGSGVKFVNRVGDIMSSILGPQFDIVGFDPRGLGQSTPRVSFFKSAAEGAILDASDLHIPWNDVAKKWALASVVGRLAEDNDDGHLRHINTDQTARDMLRIVEAHGRTKIQYWGFSYGSILGAVYASMFPDNIERLLIDGVVDSEDYFATLWSNNLVDTDKAMESFYTGCADAGPDRCAFWSSSPDDIRRNLTNLYDSIRVQPIPVKTGNTYGYVDLPILRAFVFYSLYFPFAYRHLAQGLADLASGNGTIVLKAVIPAPFECSRDPSKGLEQNFLQAQTAFYCNDGANIPGDLHSTQKHFEMMLNASEFGDIWTSYRLQCIAWPKFPKNHFQGPFEANTGHPILLIGNTADPVSPLRSAHKMSRGFNHSIVLTQNSSGHCSTSAPSLCTTKYVRQYFTDGTLPKPGTICETDLGPFDSVMEGSTEDDAQRRLHMAMNEEDKLLLSAIRELSNSQFTNFYPSFSWRR